MHHNAAAEHHERTVEDNGQVIDCISKRAGTSIQRLFGENNTSVCTIEDFSCTGLTQQRGLALLPLELPLLPDAFSSDQAFDGSRFATFHRLLRRVRHKHITDFSSCPVLSTKELAVENNARADSCAYCKEDKVSGVSGGPIRPSPKAATLTSLSTTTGPPNLASSNSRRGTSLHPSRYDVAITSPASTFVTPGTPAPTASNALFGNPAVRAHDRCRCRPNRQWPRRRDGPS